MDIASTSAIRREKIFFIWEMLIVQLYPWISVEEITTNEIAEDVSLQTNEETQTGIGNEMTEKVV